MALEENTNTLGGKFYEYNAVHAEPGDIDFYFLKFYSSSTVNPQEADDGGNGEAAKAEIATGQLEGNVTHFYVGGTLGVPDTDWWSFEANSGNEIALACSSWRAGSGVRDATFEIYADPAGNALQAETETETKSVLWSTASNASKKPIVAAKSGTHYLKITASQQAADVISNHYLCGVHVSPP